MDRRVLSILLVSLPISIKIAAVLAMSAVPTGAAETGTASSQPRYVVIAVDVSGSMDRADTPADDARGLRFTLRQDAQLVAMQLLPYLYSDLYVGVCHFSDRVRYALPSEETAPLLAWGGSYLNEAACRNMVRSPDFTGSFNTEIDAGLDWALARIQAARRQHGNGPGKIVLLSRGDPRDAARNMDIGSPLHNAASRLARQDIRIYPVIINRGSHRAGFADEEPSSSDRTAEASMTALASLTDGKAHRVTSATGLPDILMDVFGLGTPLTEEMPVSRYDWATAIVGPAPASVGIGPQGQARTRALDGQLEAEAGIRLHRITSSQWQMTILRRPAGDDRIADSWEGHWRLSEQGATRLYRIPSFVLQLGPRPAAPWWAHQEVRLAAQVVDRHQGAASVRSLDPSGDLSVRLTARSQAQSEPWPLDGGRWTIPSRLFESDPFTVQVPGLYDFRAELVHSSSDANIVLVDATSDVTVQPPCISLSALESSGEVLGSLSDRPDPLAIALHGGGQVSFRLSPQGRSGAKPISGTLHLEPLTQTDWVFRKDTAADLATESIELPEDEERISGWAEVQVETSSGVLPFRLPRFELVYQPAPVRIECAFGEPREALWAGELHRQLVTVSAFPVFERDRERVLAMFPETLSGARMRTVDLTSGTAQVMAPQARLVEVPKPTGKNGRTLTATYALESEIPLPRADQCEISLEGTIEGLRGAVKTYGVIDPVATGVLQWALYQPADGSGQAQGPAETVYCGEPVLLTARWQANQDVSAVRFEIARPEPDEAVTVDLSVDADSRQASAEQVLPGLESGQTYPVSVYITARPSNAAAPVEIKLRGGQFLARDRRLLLQELAIGDEAGKDVVCYPWEPARIPLRVVFGGYIAANAQHQALIDQVKTSCRVSVTSPLGEVQELTDSIEWTALIPSDTRQGRATRCELQGYAPYVPGKTGRAAVAMTAAFPQEQGAAVTQRANGHLAIKEPRLALSVQRLTSSQQDSLFNSQTWAAGSGGVSAVTTQLSTRLRVTVRPLNWAAATPPDIALRLLHRRSSEAPWTIAFTTEGEPASGAALTHEFQVADNGQYAVEMVGRDRQSRQIVATLTTPVLLSIHPHEIVPVLAPAAWITPHVRQWPFEYRVTVQKENGETTQVSAMSFQFQLPSDRAVWQEGSVHAIEAAPLSLKSPEVLPAMEASRDGSVQFRLSAQGHELVQWEHPNVRVLPPVLERLAFSSREDASEIASAQSRINLDGSTALWARPVFRAAPELAGQWTRGATTVYVWPADEAEATAGKPLSAQEIQRFEAKDAFTIDSGQPDQTAKVLPRLAHRGFWGWPRPAATYSYAVVASATYVRADSPDAVISEWTPVTFVSVATAKAIPWGWWVLAGLVLVLAAVFVLKMLAPRPDRLGLDALLAESVAVVEPASVNSPVAIELRPSSLRSDIDLHVAHARSQGSGAGSLVAIFASARVLLRRAFSPRKWAWALITPRISGARSVQKGLVCVWTGPLARKGGVWSSQTGAIGAPGKGQAISITLDLAYQMDTVARSMRVSVRIRNAASQTEKEGTDDLQPADSELGT